MKIVRVASTPLNVPVTIERGGKSRTTNLSMCLTEVEAEGGLVGHGFTAITEEEVIDRIVTAIAAPAMIGEDPLATERIWSRLYWLMSPRGQTGYASHALAALDVALWDLKGKILGQPVWRLLGGARARVPVYGTFGFGFLDREELAAEAKAWVARGFRYLKMTVGQHALARRDEPRPIDDVIAEDARRVRAVREAVGPGIGIVVDANCSLDAEHAYRLCRLVEDCDLMFFEEPITQNDVARMADLRRRTGVPISAGQNEGLLYRFRDLVAGEAVDALQPNVVISGGFTQAVKIAALAEAYNVGLHNGGAWSHHNMHLHAGLSHGGVVEYHAVAIACVSQIYPDLAVPQDGWLTLPETPGLGFAPDAAAVAELARRPLSGGTGKA